MNIPDHTFPPLLAELNDLEYDYADGNGIDFEPYSEFLDAEETTVWFRAWTGNNSADGTCFRIFGQDGTGGYAAFWIATPDHSILEQPIVFLGSEGETGVVASNFDSYLWLLANGLGPCEAVAYPDSEGSSNEQFLAFAQRNSSIEQTEVRKILEQARIDHPTFPSWIESLCE